MNFINNITYKRTVVLEESGETEKYGLHYPVGKMDFICVKLMKNHKKRIKNQKNQGK